ncbi:MAG: hypothetical protein IKX61_01425 [Prevotella sp.]|nr:hypothetical protein [Prevotella sp.]
MKVIYYETGCQQRNPLFSYEGCDYETAEKIVREKTTFKKFELVSIPELQKKREELKGWRQPQWYIIPDKELVTGEYL